IEIPDHVRLPVSAAETGKIATKRQLPTVVDVAAHPTQGRARSREVGVVIADVDIDTNVEDAGELCNFTLRRCALLERERRLVGDTRGSRHEMSEAQARGSPASREEREPLQFSECVAADPDFQRERKRGRPTARKSADDALEGSVAAPLIVGLARRAIEAERYMGHGLPSLDQ